MDRRSIVAIRSLANALEEIAGTASSLASRASKLAEEDDGPNNRPLEMALAMQTHAHALAELSERARELADSAHPSPAQSARLAQAAVLDVLAVIVRERLHYYTLCDDARCNRFATRYWEGTAQRWHRCDICPAPTPAVNGGDRPARKIEGAAEAQWLANWLAAEGYGSGGALPGTGGRDGR